MSSYGIGAMGCLADGSIGDAIPRLVPVMCRSQQGSERRVSQLGLRFLQTSHSGTVCTGKGKEALQKGGCLLCVFCVSLQSAASTQSLRLYCDNEISASFHPDFIPDAGHQPVRSGARVPRPDESCTISCCIVRALLDRAHALRRAIATAHRGSPP